MERDRKSRDLRDPNCSIFYGLNVCRWERLFYFWGLSDAWDPAGPRRLQNRVIYVEGALRHPLSSKLFSGSLEGGLTILCPGFCIVEEDHNGMG